MTNEKNDLVIFFLLTKLHDLIMFMFYIKPSFEKKNHQELMSTLSKTSLTKSNLIHNHTRPKPHVLPNLDICNTKSHKRFGSLILKFEVHTKPE